VTAAAADVGVPVDFGIGRADRHAFLALVNCGPFSMSYASSSGRTSRLRPPISDILRGNLDHGRRTRRVAAATLPKPSITACCLGNSCLDRLAVRAGE
jgi:hypothetical protein